VNIKYLIALFLSVLFSANSVAADKGSGTGCKPVEMRVEGFQKAAQLSNKLTQYLERKNAKEGTSVVLLGRAGSASPKSRFKAKVSDYWDYTHAALAYRDHPSGQWTVVHLLNDCGKQSSIYAQSLMKFFLDDPYEYRVVVAIPSELMQQQLQKIVVERDMATALFNNSIYFSVSNPFNTQRQNSNEYILDTLVLAIAYQHGISNIFTREQSKEYLLSSELKGFVEPERVKVKGVESLGLALGFGPDNATLDDHPRSERKDGAVNMVSVGTLIRFLQNSGNLQSSTELALRDFSKARDTRYAN
jgi:hypothetical protein